MGIGPVSPVMYSLLVAGDAAPEPGFSHEALSLGFKQAAPGGALRSSLDVPSSPPTPSSNPFAALVFHKSPVRSSAQPPPVPSARSLDLEPALPRVVPEQDGPQARLSRPPSTPEPSLAAPSSVQTQSTASQASSAASAVPAACAAGTASNSLAAPPTHLPALRGNPDTNASQLPSLQEAPEGVATEQAALKARPPPSVFAGTVTFHVLRPPANIPW